MQEKKYLQSFFSLFASDQSYQTKVMADLSKKVQAIPLLTLPMTPENEKVVDIPAGQKDFLCVMDYTAIDKNIVPPEFNGMIVWHDLLSPTQDQAECGACWAFASSTCLADRFNIIARRQVIPTVSTNFSLLCAFNEDLLASKVIAATNYQSEQQQIDKLNKLNSAQFQCGGNYLLTAWCALYAAGTTTDDCLPYKLVDPFKKQYELLDFGFNGRTAFLDTTSADKIKNQNFFFLLDKANATWSCSSIVGNNKELCWEHTVMNNEMLAIPLRHYFCGLIYQIKDDKDLDLAIRYDMMRFGPVSTVMNVFDSFFAFDPVNGGVYNPTEDPSTSNGGHAIEIVGWGVFQNTPFWWIRNSWSAAWGIDGCFRLARGNKSCDVEANIITGIPYFFYTPDQYDRFLDLFPLHNPIVIKEPYQNCLANPWMQKYFAIYYKPIQIDLYQPNPTKRLTYFRILAQHPGQKAVLYPQYGITTKIMSVYPGVLEEPDPDPELLLYWFQQPGAIASDTSKMLMDYAPLSYRLSILPWEFWLRILYWILFVLLLILILWRMSAQRQRSRSIR